MKVLVKNSTATITIKKDAQLLSSDTLGVYATAGADASGAASGSLFSIGVAYASATATVDIQTGVVMMARRGRGRHGGRERDGFDERVDRADDQEHAEPRARAGRPIARGHDAEATSHVTVADGARIEARKTANIFASGEVELGGRGRVGHLRRRRRRPRLRARVLEGGHPHHGERHRDRHMDPGSVVKIEIDPVADYTSDDDPDCDLTDDVPKCLKKGDVVKVLFAVAGPNPGDPDYAAGTFFQYLGPPQTGTVDLGSQDYSDPDMWLAEPVGYVDYASDMIHVGPHALVTEDVIKYTNRRGTSIGNLVDGRDYYVIALTDDEDTPTRDESEWIKLAPTEIQAIRAGVDPSKYSAGNVVNLIDQTGTPIFTDTNVRDFAGATSRPTKTRSTSVAGRRLQHVRARPGGRLPRRARRRFQGLVNGGTYYVVASTNQTNLQGDTRFADAQVIGLAESENEARGGVRIDIGPSSGKGYKLEAKHVLDSNFATGIGVFAALDAEEKVGASAGLASESSNTNHWAEFKEGLGTNLPDLIFTELTKSYTDNQAKANRRLDQRASASRARSPSSSPTTTLSPRSAPRRDAPVERGSRGQGDDRAEADARRGEQRRAADERGRNGEQRRHDGQRRGRRGGRRQPRDRDGARRREARRPARDAGDLGRLVPVPDALRPVHPALVGRARRLDPQRGLRRRS